MEKEKSLNLYYAVLQYMPDPIRRESINVGIVFHIPSLKLSKFVNIKNKNRIKSFDDEYDSEYIQLMFESFKFEFNSDQLDEYGDRFKNLDSPTFLEENTKFYVNEFRFLPVAAIETTERHFDKDIVDLTSTYLYYDKPKGQRITTNEVKTLMKKQLRILNFDFKKNRKNITSDFYKDEIFDYASTDLALKAISFDKSRSKDLSNELKILYYDLATKKDQIGNTQIIIVVDNGISQLPEEVEKMQIFKEFSDKIEKDFSNVSIYPLAKFAENITSSS